MYSWKTTRNFCAVLLLVPLVHLAYLMSSETLSLLDSSPQVWEPEVNAYNDNVRIEDLPAAPVVVVGGRLVTLWPGLENLLAPRPVLMRGIGDATVDDIIYHYQQLIGFYRPGTLVVLPGNSEFHIRDNKSPEELVAAIRKLEALDAAHGYTRLFYVFSPVLTPLYPGDRAKLTAAGEQLAEWAAAEPRVRFLDANPLLRGANGGPDPQFFRGDGVHLNENGFLRLALLLRQTLNDQDPPPAKSGR
jgi:hypothetical protein